VSTPGRRSIHIDSFQHSNPIPGACRIGPMIASSVIVGRNPGETVVPDDIESQIANLFSHMGEMLREAGAGWEHVIKIDFSVPSLDDRPAINRPFLDHFPDPDSRPARHTSAGSTNAQCTFWAYVEA
jgi:enamine deaminase RidA (YjgF/YER057c/UK114 family)